MADSAETHSAFADWIAQQAIPFALEADGSIHAAVNKLSGRLGNSVELLGLGEALHGGEEILIFRNRLFERLVEAHGYSAIAVESSFPRGRIVNEYVLGRGPASYEEIVERGFSHGFGRLEANRELGEWMRSYNAQPRRSVKLQFYGFDSPTEMTTSDSPRQLLEIALAYLESVDRASGRERRSRIEPLLGEDAAWENPAAAFDPSQGIGLSPSAAALRIETEELLSELRVRRVEFTRVRGAAPPLTLPQNAEGTHVEAVHCAELARQMLNYHAALARTSSKRLEELLGLRDLIMADNLAYILRRERGRGKVLAFAHNSHLKRGPAQWQLGPELLTWWPAGAHLEQMLGSRYVAVGSAVGVSEPNGIGEPEAGTLEARLTAAAGPVRFIPTQPGHGTAAEEVAALPTRSGSTKNPTYFPLSGTSLSEFDWLVVFDSMRYSRGGPALGS